MTELGARNRGELAMWATRPAGHTQSAYLRGSRGCVSLPPTSVWGQAHNRPVKVER